MILKSAHYGYDYRIPELFHIWIHMLPDRIGCRSLVSVSWRYWSLRQIIVTFQG